MSTSSGRPRPRSSDQILLVDRCLSPEIAHEISKADGMYSIALHEHYGDAVAQSLADVTFLAHAGEAGWAVLTQNPRMWQVPDGKPEPLVANLSGYWSKRITDEHRLVYKVDGDNLFIAQARYHYSS